MEDDAPEEMIEQMPVVLRRKMQKLATMQIALKKQEGAISVLKAEILEMAGDHDYAPVEHRGIKVSVFKRMPSRKIDVVALVKAGYRKEDFSTVKPTIERLMALASKKKWTERQVEQYIIPGEGDPVRYLRLEELPDEETDQ